MARACKFCHYVNGFICDDFQDCIGCGRCKPKPEPKEEEKQYESKPD